MPFGFFEKSEKDKYLSEARKCKRRGEYDRAGDFFFMAGEVDEALAMYEAGGHHTQAAQMLEKKGDLKRAAEQYVQARDFRAAALLFQKVGEAKKASTLFEKAGEIFKAAQIEEQTRSHKRAAELFLRAGHLDRASQNYAREGEFLRAAETLEDHLNKLAAGPERRQETDKMWAQAAELYVRAGRFKRAADLYARIGNTSMAGAAYEKAGEHSAALDQYLKAGDQDRAFAAASRAPEGTIEPRVMAELRYLRGEWREAGELFRLVREPARAAECFEKAGEKVLAAEQYERAGEYELAGDLLYAAAEHERASQVYERAMRYLMAARAADEAGNFERAARLFTEAREPVEAARAHRKVGQIDQAIAVLQQVVPSADAYTEASTLLGDLFRDKGLHSIAVEKYRAAIGDRGVDETTIDACFGLATTLEDLGEASKALELYERIVATNYGYRDAAKRLEALRGLRRSGGNTMTRPLPAPGTTSGAGFPAASEPGTAVLADSNVTGSTSGAFGRRYEIVSRIGSTGAGEAYKAWDTSLNRTVVIKRLVAHDQNEEGQFNRFIHEAQQASKLHHSNIATIYDAMEAPEGRYVATEYVFGESLRDVLKRDGRLPPARAVEIASQILLALEYAHGVGVTHRNLRPENVLISEKSHVKLTDFGMNRRYSDLEKEPAGEASPLHYVAPELVRGEKADPRTDLYALGCMLYEMLTGQPPFTGPDLGRRHLNDAPVPPSVRESSVPASVEKVVLRCLEKEPGKRYASARHVYEELKAFDFMPGQRLGDRYELLRELGTGGMGKVFMARDLELDEVIAMKVLRPEFGTDPMLEQRFIREIKLARKIVHPSVVKVYDFGKFKNLKYITMEYIEGLSLEEYVKRTKPVDVREICRFIMQICEALDAAHRLGVVHRDIKPQNVLISGADRRAKIVDFGIARIEAHENLTSSRLIIGSPKYMSPEQISGKNVDHRTDIYSLGVVLYYCATGIEPFTAEDTNGIILKQLNEAPVPPCQVNPDLPPWLEMVILKAMVKDPRGRYQRAADFAREIAAHLH